MTIEERLLKLERENMNLKRICISTVLLCMLVVTLGAAASTTGVINADVVTAKKFVLYDDDGETERGEWSVKDKVTILENRQVFSDGIIRARFVCKQNGGGAVELLGPGDGIAGEFTLVEGASPTINMKTVGGGDTRIRIRARSTAGMEIYGRANPNTPTISLTAP